jgi:hypothetical protein
MAESLSLLSNFQKIVYDRIEDLRGRIYEAHNPIYNESLMIEIIDLDINDRILLLLLLPKML